MVWENIQSRGGLGIRASLMGRYHLNLKKGDSVKAIFSCETIEGY